MLLFLLAPLALAHPDDTHVDVQGSVQFFPDDIVAEHLKARLVDDHDSFLGAEARLAPDGRWLGRASAGVDVLGGDNWDFDLGLFLGGAGTLANRDVEMVTKPQAGTEVAFGIALKHVYGKYRWLAGWGGGPLDDLMTENELTLGYRIGDVKLFGELTRLNPHHADPETSTGLGVGVVF